MKKEIVAARDSEPMLTETQLGRWLVSWHSAATIPEGRSHGAAGICVSDDEHLILISPDGVHWGFPAGRPEGTETLRETLDREMREEACVTVLDARLLGFSRSELIDGHEKGLVLIRSYWLADVETEPWDPQFEIVHRRVVPAVNATTYVRDPDTVATRISFRALAEAKLG